VASTTTKEVINSKNDSKEKLTIRTDTVQEFEEDTVNFRTILLRDFIAVPWR
jgi:hypothetical protein